MISNHKIKIIIEIIYEKDPRYYHRTPKNNKQTQNPKDNDVNDNIITYDNPYLRYNHQKQT